VLGAFDRREVSAVTATLVVAFGNPLRGDDGLGPAVIGALRGRALGPHVELVDAGTASLDTAFTLQDRSRIIVIDAAECGTAPGTVRRVTLTARALESRPVRANALHAAGLMEALGLAAALGSLPEQITLFAVQPRSLAFGTKLSEEVRTAVPTVVESIVALLAEA
jgi:hydrogenase maturation protease